MFFSLGDFLLRNGPFAVWIFMMSCAFIDYLLFVSWVRTKFCPFIKLHFVGDLVLLIKGFGSEYFGQFGSTGCFEQIHFLLSQAGLLACFCLEVLFRPKIMQSFREMSQPGHTSIFICFQHCWVDLSNRRVFDFMLVGRTILFVIDLVLYCWIGFDWHEMECFRLAFLVG